MEAKETSAYITALKAEAKEHRGYVILFGVLTMVLLICTIIFWEGLGDYVIAIRIIDLPILGGRLICHSTNRNQCVQDCFPL